jgi:hypothetical protein
MLVSQLGPPMREMLVEEGLEPKFHLKMKIGGWRRNCRVPPTSAIGRSPPIHRANREGQERVESRPTGVGQGTAGIGRRPGIRRYAVSPRLRPDRSFGARTRAERGGAKRDLQVSSTLDLCCTGLRGSVEVGSAYRRAEPFPADHCASEASNSSASLISGISGVGKKPSRAGTRTSWASAGRAVDW